MSITFVLTHRPGSALLLVLGGPILAAVLVGCGQIEASVQAAQATQTAAPPPPPPPTPPPTPTPHPGATSVRTVPLGRPTGTPPMGRPLPDDRVAEILALLLLRDPDPVMLEDALDEVVRNRDVRFIAPLVELMRAGPMQLAELDSEHAAALQALSRAVHPQAWDRWFEWYGTTSLVPPPGFTTWKGRLLSGLDERYAEYIRDDQPADLRVEQIVWSGVTPDHTRPLDQPAFVASDSEEAGYLQPGEPVFGVYVNGEARAYPLRIMDVHEIANDEVGGVPVTLAYCTLTGSSVLYDRRAPDGETYDFSGTGLVYQSNRLMYDRQTETLWNSLTGRPVLGPLVTAAAGTTGSWLDTIPIVTARWEDWLRDHPDTLVLSEDVGLGRGYAPGFPHLEYFSSGDTIYPVAERDGRQLTKSWVYGVVVGSAAKAYPVRTVFDEHVVNDRIDDVELVVVGDGQGRGIRIRVELPQLGEVRYFVGGAVRAYQRPAGVTFVPGPTPDIVLDEDGEAWRVTEEALVSPSGEVAPRMSGQLAYWFGWRAFQPHTAIYGITHQPLRR